MQKTNARKTNQSSAMQKSSKAPSKSQSKSPVATKRPVQRAMSTSAGRANKASAQQQKHASRSAKYSQKRSFSSAPITIAVQPRLPTTIRRASPITRFSPKGSIPTPKETTFAGKFQLSQQQTRHHSIASFQKSTPKSSLLLTTQQKFAKLPQVVTVSGLIQQFATPESSLITLSAREISTMISANSPLSSHANKSLRQLASSNISLVPHSSTISTNPIDLVPVFTPLRSFAQQKAKPDAKKAADKKKTGGMEVDAGEEAFAQAGDVKKNVRNWLEQIFTSQPDVHPMPEAAQKNEELFVQECQMRFAQRLDKRTRYEQAKIILKQRAIEQLPNELKLAAKKDDPALWSMRIMTPFSDPPRKRWLLDHYQIPYKPSQQEIDDEDFLKKKYARL